MVSVIDMGTHLLPRVTGMRLVLQLLVPGLEERARAFPALLSSHHTPGGFGMPGCLQAACCSAA